MGADGEVAFPDDTRRQAKTIAREVRFAPGVCLEEMTSGRCRRRVIYGEPPPLCPSFDQELRRLTADTARDSGALIAEGRTPPPVWKASLCRACSLIESCRPKAMAKSALGFRRRALDAALAPDSATGETRP